MPFFIKKPVVVEAKQFIQEELDQQNDLADWCRGKLCGILLPGVDRVIQIQTLEGEMEAKFGDWIIKGVAGEFYPCKPDIFEATFEKLS